MVKAVSDARAQTIKVQKSPKFGEVDGQSGERCEFR